jgi:acetyl esterase/lipase
MVMGRRPDVPTADGPVTAITVASLGAQLGFALASVPFRRPWAGRAGLADNLGAATTREVMRTFMGFSMSLPTPEFRSLEVLIDDLCRVVLPPFVHRLGVDMTREEIRGVPVIRYHRRAPAEPAGSILYLHGGGYIGTSCTMYAAFNGYLAHETGCDVVVPDYRLAPEFPFPAGLLDAIAVAEGMLAAGVDPARWFVAGDSGGGGLASTLVLDSRAQHLPDPAGLVLFSPEVDLTLDEDSVRENAATDILPWNIPTGAYLHGLDPHDGEISTINADLRGFPPTFVAFGDKEMFRDPIRRFVARLQDAEVPTTVVEEPDMFHVYPFLMPWADAARRTYRAVGDFVADRLRAAGVEAVRPESA